MTAQRPEQGQKIFKKAEEKKAPRYTYPLLNGLMVGVNLFDPIANAFGQSYGGYDISLELNLYNRFFPIWEVGVGRAKNTPEEMNFTYIGNTALFNRIGMNYNFKYKSESPNFFYIGVRYGFSMFSYDIKDITLDAPYWGEQSNENILNQKSNAHWIEGLGGIRVKVYKDLYMGWSVRYKWMLSSKKNFNSEPWFIPGYGTSGTPFSITYSIYYNIPLSKKKSAPVIPANKTK